jgi:hypothetical protein
MRFFCLRCQRLVLGSRCPRPTMPPDCPLRGEPAILPVAIPAQWLQLVESPPPTEKELAGTNAY